MAGRFAAPREVVESNPAPPRGKGLLMIVEDRNTKAQLDAAPLGERRRFLPR
jgi:hypothetical protein